MRGDASKPSPPPTLLVSLLWGCKEHSASFGQAEVQNLRVGGIQCTRRFDPDSQQLFEFQRAACDGVLQRLSPQEFHDDQRACPHARKSRKLCKCWGCSGGKPSVPPGGSVRVPADLSLGNPRGISGQRDGQLSVLGLVDDTM